VLHCGIELQCYASVNLEPGGMSEGKRYYRLRLISPLFGVDESGPLHPTQDHARHIARVLARVYRGNLQAEIRRVIDLRLQKSEWVETVDFSDIAE
jgi:hypothetical protein